MAKILLIDDFEDNLIALEALISDLFPNHKLYETTDGESGIELAKFHQPDLILLDILMPKMDGFEVCRALKNDENTADIPIVFVTALKETKANRIKALQVGADGFLTKPIEETELEAQVKAMLKIKEANDIKRNENEHLQKLVEERTQKLQNELVERKKVEEALKESQRQLSTLMGNLPGIAYRCMMDRNRKMEYISDGCIELTGYQPGDIINSNKLSYNDIIHPQFREYVFSKVSEAVSKKTRFEMEYQIVSKGGTEKWVWEQGCGIYSETGGVIALEGFITNITDYKIAKEEVQKERLLLRTLIDNLPSSIYVKDIEGRKILANKTDYTNIGAAREEDVLGKKDTELFEGPVGERGYQDDMHVIKTGLAILNKEEDFVLKSGKTRWALSSKIPLKNSTGKITGLVGINHNITESKKLFEELAFAKKKAEESDRLKSAFLANMSHEIRTPMNGILGFLEILQKPNLDESLRKSYLQIVNQSGQRLLNTINDIIEISKIESGNIPVVISHIELKSFLRYYHDFFWKQANEKGLELIVQENEIPANDFFCDKIKLDSIFTNLIKNAIKFTESGSITFGFTLKEGFIEFYIKDNGIGIPENRREAIFERFVQADIEDKLVFQGTGLGLSIVRAYVEKLNGKIWLESIENRGTTFYFMLPYGNKNTQTKGIEDRGIVIQNQNSQPSPIIGEKSKILIVEDDEVSSFFIEVLLKESNYEIVKSFNGAEAVDMCQKEPDIDLILMDMKMPVMDGYESTRKIREFNKEVVIIAQTAFTLSGDREKALNAGCNDFIPKPIKKEKLEKLLEKYLCKGQVISHDNKTMSR